MVKKDITQLSLEEGVIQNTIFSSTGMKRGRHHLFDEIDKGITESTAGGGFGESQDFN